MHIQPVPCIVGDECASWRGTTVHSAVLENVVIENEYLKFARFPYHIWKITHWILTSAYEILVRYRDAAGMVHARVGQIVTFGRYGFPACP